MSIVNGRTGADWSGEELYLSCRRCGLSIAPRAKWLRVEHCPRCLARSRTLVELFASPLPTRELYWHGVAPAGRRPDRESREARSVTTRSVDRPGSALADRPHDRRAEL